MHDDEKPNEEIAELLQRSLSLDDPTSAVGQRVPTASNDGEENTLLVGSSDSSVEGYVFVIRIDLPEFENTFPLSGMK